MENMSKIEEMSKLKLKDILTDYSKIKIGDSMVNTNVMCPHPLSETLNIFNQSSVCLNLNAEKRSIKDLPGYNTSKEYALASNKIREEI